MSSPNFEIGPPDRDLYLKAAGIPYVKLTTAGALTAIGGGSITAATPALTWTAEAFDEDHFAGNGAMTVTAVAEDVVCNRYIIMGKLMIWHLVLETLTVGGTPDTQILVTVPGGQALVNASMGSYHYVDNGTKGTGLWMAAQADATTVSFAKSDFEAAWTAATNASAIRATLLLELA